MDAPVSPDLPNHPPGSIPNLIDRFSAATGKLTGTGPIIFLHTGGTPALFVYPDVAGVE